MYFHDTTYILAIWESVDSASAAVFWEGMDFSYTQSIVIVSYWHIRWTKLLYL